MIIMRQKVIKVGDSAAVIIPKKSMEGLNFDIGDEIEVKVDEEKNEVKMKPAVDVDKELMDWTEGFIEEYRPRLKGAVSKVNCGVSGSSGNFDNSC